MAELSSAETWLYSTLTNDATIRGIVGTRVYSAIATSPTMPYILFQYQAAADVSYMAAIRAWSRLVYLVRAVDEQNSIVGSLQTLADRIDAVLHRQSTQIGGGPLISCVRDLPFTLPERDGDRIIRHLGGIYRLQIR